MHSPSQRSPDPSANSCPFKLTSSCGIRFTSLTTFILFNLYASSTQLYETVRFFKKKKQTNILISQQMIFIASELCCPLLVIECTYVGHSTHCGNYSSHPAVYSESCRWTRIVVWPGSSVVGSWQSPHGPSACVTPRARLQTTLSMPRTQFNNRSKCVHIELHEMCKTYGTLGFTEVCYDGKLKNILMSEGDLLYAEGLYRSRVNYF